MENTIVHKSSLKGRILREILRKMILKGGKDMIYDLPEPSAKHEAPWTVPEGYVSRISVWPGPFLREQNDVEGSGCFYQEASF
jgi:hypothetical protein